MTPDSTVIGHAGSPQTRALDGGTADLLVIGGGIAGLVAARRAARGGACVTLCEANGRLGGMLERARLEAPVGTSDGVAKAEGAASASSAVGATIDIGAEAFAVRGGAVAALLHELGLGDDIVAPVARGSWGYADGAAYALPATGLLGIPAHPNADDVRAALGDAGAALAARDADLDPAVGADEASLAGLVRARMGDAVLERLVGPVARGVYSTDPRLLEHERITPGLAARIASAGGLAPAVAQVRAAAPPGAAVNGLRGGMWRLVDALEREVRATCDVRMGARVVRVASTGVGGCTWTAELSDGGRLRARAVALTVDPCTAGIDVPALGDAVAALGADAVTPAEVVALLVHAPELDAFPRGTGVLVGDRPGEVWAKALTHATTKWTWLAESLPPGWHVLRLSYGPDPAGRDPLAPRTRGLATEALIDLARRDASHLLGTPLARAGVGAHARREWRIPHPAARLGRGDALETLRERAAGVPGLGLAGTWIDGTGLATVVPAASRVADALLA